MSTSCRAPDLPAAITCCGLHRTLNADFLPPEKNCIQVYAQVIAFACSFSPAAESPCSKFDANDGDCASLRCFCLML